ncbi:MAG: NH(3)-dependent NAD(+) synthetase [Thermoanaerobacterales bacterium 50_218]|nr:MAG: NH(3)-dependent NAD(+) synthetase [Thermoanaerobacterales bacterium 50_218]HAA89678.1 NAD(+) synthetase [Peptococcaceae bacterium]
MRGNFHEEEVSRDLVAWIRQKVFEAGAKGVVFGLSGGLDSAVVAALCKRAFPESTLALILPCYSSEQDLHDAQLVVNSFGLDYKVISLDGVYDQLLKALGVSRENAVNPTYRMALANLKPRLRMTVLYYYANINNYLVVGTGNRSELTVGYFTKYGDGGVDLLPLGNLVKGQVRSLARYLGVPEKIIEKPPSAGLWQNQTDEGELGFSYQVLDDYILYGKAPPEVKAKIERMHRNSEHKRKTPPIPVFGEEG